MTESSGSCRWAEAPRTKPSIAPARVLDPVRPGVVGKVGNRAIAELERPDAARPLVGRGTGMQVSRGMPSAPGYVPK